MEKEAQRADIPKALSVEEREEHRLQHASFEPWCETCVMGQGKDAQQRQQEDKREHIIYFDCLFFSRTGEETSKEEGRKQKGLITVLTAICEGSQSPFAVVVPSNGGGYYARDAFLAWIKELGWVKVTIQVDQEMLGTNSTSVCEIFYQDRSAFANHRDTVLSHWRMET